MKIRNTQVLIEKKQILLIKCFLSYSKNAYFQTPVRVRTKIILKSIRWNLVPYIDNWSLKEKYQDCVHWINQVLTLKINLNQT